MKLLGIGGGGSKSSSSQTSQETTNYNKTGTVTPTAPSWVENPAKDLMTGIGQLANTNPASLVPGPNGYQTDALARVNSLTGSGWNFDLAAEIAKSIGTSSGASSVTAASLLEGLENYFNPYQEKVIDASMADFDFAAGKQRAQETLDMAANDAFRGSGAALTRAAGEDARLRARNSIYAGLLQQGWDSATQLANADAQRRQEAAVQSAQLAMQEQANRLAAAQMLVNNSLAWDQNQRSNAELVFDMGEALRSIEQQQAQAPFAMYDTLVNLWGGVAAPFFGSTSQESGTSDSAGSATTKGKAFKLGFGKQ